MARLPNCVCDAKLAEAITTTLSRIKTFESGPPDVNTIDVLEDAQAFIR